MTQRIYIAVINDLSNDQRVLRVANSLRQSGAEITLIGRRLKSSIDFHPKGLKVTRFRLPVKSGPLFYALFNIRLFLYLLFVPAGTVISNDLDTLPACFYVTWFRKMKLIYDSHELFTEVPELIGKNLTKKIWTFFEKHLLPRIARTSTVSESIALEYNRRYGISMHVIRNVPLRLDYAGILHSDPLVLPEKPGRIIYQGTLNKDRGIEKIIRASKYLNNAVVIIAGDGDIACQLKNLAIEEGVITRIIFTGKLSPEQLKLFTVHAHVGVSLEENTNLNYYYALPNKLFDYIQANIPVLVSDFPEMSAIVKHYDIGKVTNSTEPRDIAFILQEMLNNSEERTKWKNNLIKASAELCWENEWQTAKELYVSAGIIFPENGSGT